MFEQQKGNRFDAQEWKIYLHIIDKINSDLPNQNFQYKNVGSNICNSIPEIVVFFSSLEKHGVYLLYIYTRNNSDGNNNT